MKKIIILISCFLNFVEMYSSDLDLANCDQSKNNTSVSRKKKRSCGLDLRYKRLQNRLEDFHVKNHNVAYIPSISLSELNTFENLHREVFIFINTIGHIFCPGDYVMCESFFVKYLKTAHNFEISPTVLFKKWLELRESEKGIQRLKIREIKSLVMEEYQKLFSLEFNPDKLENMDSVF